jgi:hypothetical protein
MEFNFIKKFESMNNTLKKTSKEDSDSKVFHSDCKFSRKKVCSCKFNQHTNQQENDFSNFVLDLVNKKVTISDKNKTITITKPQEIDKYKSERSKLSLEKLKTVEYSKIKDFIKFEEERSLTYSDYKEIERSINEDKKICENCKTNIYENNFHKGWKNEAGDYILLCPTCSKKYFNGALEVKFENSMRREEMVSVSKSFQSAPVQFRTVIEPQNSNPLSKT